MLETPRITHVDACQTAVIHLTIPRRDRCCHRAWHRRTNGCRQCAEIGPTGPWFSHHLAMHPDTFDFEIGVPVSAAVSPVGRVMPGSLPGQRVARTVLHGNYEGLGDGWGAFMGWIQAQGHATAPDLWEVYAKGPQSDPDPASWRTELNKPLLG